MPEGRAASSPSNTPWQAISFTRLRISAGELGTPGRRSGWALPTRLYGLAKRGPALTRRQCALPRRAGLPLQIGLPPQSGLSLLARRPQIAPLIDHSAMQTELKIHG